MGGNNMKKHRLLRVAVILSVCITALLIATPVLAMWSWCDIDPVLSIGGNTVQLHAIVYCETPEEIRGHVVFEVTVPKGTDASVISIDPYVKAKVKIKENKKAPAGQVVVTVDINTKKTYDVQFEVTLNGVQIAFITGDTKNSPEFAFDIP